MRSHHLKRTLPYDPTYLIIATTCISKRLFRRAYQRIRVGVFSSRSLLVAIGVSSAKLAFYCHSIKGSQARFISSSVLPAENFTSVCGYRDERRFVGLSEFARLNRLQPSVQAGIISAHTAESWSRAAYGAFHENAPAQRDEAVRSVSLAAMPLMLAGQERGWATCPMSGFDPDAVRQVAGLAENLLPVLLVAIGKPELNQKQKIRMPVNHVLTII